jgi:hypothetical protein
MTVTAGQCRDVFCELAASRCEPGLRTSCDIADRLLVARPGWPLAMYSTLRTSNLWTIEASRVDR